MHTAPDRKLTTILSADVAGYSAMMERDEPGTLALLKTSRDLMSRGIAGYRGRIVNTAGDGLLAEFASVVNAVECAVRIQRNLAERNAGLSEAARMRFRIGINLGDVMEDGSDLYGDGVNVAARLESIADPGGIMVSETVFNLTNRHLAFGYDFAGEQKVKGQDDPIPSYRVRMPGRNAEGAESAGGDTKTKPRKSDASVFGRPSPAVGEPAKADRSLATRRGKFVDRQLARIRRFRGWYRRQPRGVRIPVAAIGMFATINLLTTGLSEVWFVFPSIPFALVLIYHFLARRT